MLYNDFDVRSLKDNAISNPYLSREDEMYDGWEHLVQENYLGRYESNDSKVKLTTFAKESTEPPITDINDDLTLGS